MNTRRTIQLILFLISLGLGLTGLFIWQPSGKLECADNALSPLKTTSFRVGAQIEDESSDNDSRDKVIREVTPASYSTLNYVVCEIDDDPDQLNAFGIYHPIDLAITLGNLKKQGVKHLFISTHLHWPEREPEETNTLATALEAFDSVVVTAPVRRNLSSDIISPAFLKASIPVTSAHGDVGLLPAVNSLSIPTDVKFPANTYAGFSSLESESASATTPLLARWDDRIIFSAQLLALMQHSKISPDQLSVHPGNYIRLGNTGNIIPIDDFGHYQPDASFTEKSPPRQLTSALSGQATIIGATQSFAILTATGERSSEFEAIGSPYQKLTQLSYTPRVSNAQTLARLPLWLEIILIVDLALLAAWLLSYRGLRRHSYYLASLVGTYLIFFGLQQLSSYWSPISLYLIPLAAGWLIAIVLSKFQISNQQS